MKNYALNEKEEYNFILNYKKDKDKIIIKYANGDQFLMPYSIELEKKLLQQMRNQVMNSEKAKNQIKRKKGTVRKMMIAASVLLGLVAGGSILIADSFLIALGCVGAGIVSVTAGGINLRKQNSILRDIEKTQTFIEKENLFQTKVYDGMGMFLDTNKATKGFVKDISNINEKRSTMTEDDIEKLNLNYIDQMSYDTFFDIVDLIEKNEQFEDVVSKPRTRTLSKANQFRSNQQKAIDVRID